MGIPENNWLYAKSVKAAFEVKDSTQAYNFHFRLRNTAAYRYANIYVVLHIKGKDFGKAVRYQFKLAKPDGQWLGKGAGDLYTSDFSLLTNYRFAKTGKYEVEIEQNMRDNPLVGISDAGLTIEKSEQLQ